MQHPVLRIKRDFDVIHQPGFAVNLEGKHRAIDTSALDPAHVVIRRADPLARDRANELTLSPYFTRWPDHPISYRRLWRWHKGKAAEVRQIRKLARTRCLQFVAAGIDRERVACSRSCRQWHH